MALDLSFVSLSLNIHTKNQSEGISSCLTASLCHRQLNQERKVNLWTPKKILYIKTALNPHHQGYMAIHSTKILVWIVLVLSELGWQWVRGGERECECELDISSDALSAHAVHNLIFRPEARRPETERDLLGGKVTVIHSSLPVTFISTGAQLP